MTAKRPNIVVVLLDDVGFSDIGCYGSEIATPAMDKLAAGGIRYSNFHVTPMCSPTRAALLSGRNPHAVGVGIVAEWANGMPGYDGRVHPSAGMLPQVLQENGYNTLAVGKWHLTATEEYGAAGPFSNWPLSKGFNRWYGFHGALTDQFHPELCVDNHLVHLEAKPGYHLTEDLVDNAIGMVRDHVSTARGRPFFLYLALGACHWPHQAPREFTERQRGRYDTGWDSIREGRLKKQVELGIVPTGTQLAPRDPDVRAWDEMSADDDAVRLSTRLQEAYAGFMEHTDLHLSRLFDALEALEIDDNTVVMLLSDNGASAEGGATGAINLRKHMVYEKDDPGQALSHLEDIGTARAYNHYSTGWAQVSNTPLKWYKKNTHGGGIRGPLIVRWPGVVPGAGEVRTQFYDVIDIMPTLLAQLDIAPPESLAGVAQQPLHGMDMSPSFGSDDPSCRRPLQYFELLGDRALWQDGWKAVGRHRKGADPEMDVWELYHLDEDFAEARDLAIQEPERLERMKALWLEEAGRNQVLPIDDREWDRAADRIRRLSRAKHVFFPGSARIDRLAVPDITGRSFVIRAYLEKQGPLQGVLLAWGSRFGGFTFYVQDAQVVLRYVFSQDVSHEVRVPETVPRGRPACILAIFERQEDGSTVVRIEGTGLTPASMRVPRTWPVTGTTAGLSCGADHGHPVCDDYARPFPFAGGALGRVEIDVSPGAVTAAWDPEDAIAYED